MPTAIITVGVKASGRLFDGLAVEHGLDRLLAQIKEELAQYGLYLLLMRLHDMLQNPTGYYESRIKIERMQADRMLTDSGVVYGPWLEGTSSRNQTTRFKGYHSFRTATHQLDQKKVEIAQPFVDRFISEMN